MKVINSLLYTATDFPDCCMILIIHNIRTANGKTDDLDISEEIRRLKNVMDEYETNCVYATLINQQLITVLEKIGFTIIDVNGNQNSGNAVYTLKYLIEK